MPNKRTTPSIKNEPWYGESYHWRYPDMYQVYEMFSKRFEIHRDNFILTNGCENALRIALLALGRNKKLTIENPTWALTNVIAESFDMRYDHLNYEYQDGKFIPEHKEDIELLYVTDTYNNLFKHEMPEIPSNAIVIIDETYTLAALRNPGRQITDNKVIIGSFSKFSGPGYRIGYIIFPYWLKEKMNMLREQYISQEAADMITGYADPWYDLHFLFSEYDYHIPYKIVTKHPVYTTVEADEVPLPHKKFSLSGHNFCRIGTLGDRKAWERKMNGLS